MRDQRSTAKVQEAQEHEKNALQSVHVLTRAEQVTVQSLLVQRFPSVNFENNVTTRHSRMLGAVGLPVTPHEKEKKKKPGRNGGMASVAPREAAVGQRSSAKWHGLVQRVPNQS